VCLVREEAQNVARTAAFARGGSWTPSSDRTAQLRGGVPRRAVAFLQVASESRVQAFVLDPNRNIEDFVNQLDARHCTASRLDIPICCSHKLTLEPAIKVSSWTLSGAAGSHESAQPRGAARVPAQGIHIGLGRGRPRTGWQRQVSEGSDAA
jgi:hypothetical protein